MTKDINIHESGSGGEFSIVSNDLIIGESLYQQVYLALFGGNVEAVTRGDEPFGEERLDWWGNPLFFSEIPNKQFNSTTEKVLQEVVMNSSGRLSILRAMNEDLSYVTILANYTADVQFVSENHIRLIVNFTPKGNQQDRTLQLIYDNAKNEIIIEKQI